ncbi:hypothetical protein BOTBODRAFT_410365 [Botryobasidium botryosum FD-172 SS1]|uniref:Uncharacterized protein n=1 Tax=Botryobasidium botryosum (strain FD-172 SS1) TaxID=930990 RepID=A0A067MLM8_BOTB1|nr:hypothetical protein BOTBODRAFT_410365 [Botryobasidium botryosum FD-172 SS1]
MSEQPAARDEYTSDPFNFGEEVAPYEDDDGAYEEYDEEQYGDIDGLWDDNFEDPALAPQPQPEPIPSPLTSSTPKRRLEESEDENAHEGVADVSVQGMWIMKG